MNEQLRQPTPRASDPADRALRYATLFYAVGLAVHTADHFRRGTDVLTGEVTALGYLSTLGGLVVIALVFLRHRFAPAVAAIFGLTVAVGVGATHLLPRWSDFSDPFPGHHDTGVTALSWFVVLLEIAGLLAMSAAGFYALRRSRGVTPVGA